jgi:hypothetical protein
VRELVEARPPGDEELLRAVAVEIDRDEPVLPDGDLDPAAAQRIEPRRVVPSTCSDGSPATPTPKWTSSVPSNMGCVGVHAPTPAADTVMPAGP